MSKKIAIIYSGGKYWGGIETYILNLFRFGNNEEISFTLFSLGEWPLTEKLRKEGVRVKVFSGTRFRPKNFS